jgi:hypothetical protein
MEPSTVTNYATSPFSILYFQTMSWLEVIIIKKWLFDKSSMSMLMWGRMETTTLWMVCQIKSVFNFPNKIILYCDFELTVWSCQLMKSVKRNPFGIFNSSLNLLWMTQYCMYFWTVIFQCKLSYLNVLFCKKEYLCLLL